MNYTEEQFQALAPYEDNFRTAVEGHWTRRISVDGQKLIRSIYQEATGEKAPFNVGCAVCVVTILRRAGRLWFQDKEEREKAAENPEQAAPDPAEDAPKKKAAPKSGKTAKTAKTAQK